MKSILRPFLSLSVCLALASSMPATAGPSDLKLSTVVIDPGHGGHDAGCISKDRKTYEKNLTLDISRRLAQKIRESYPDVKVIMTRNEDKYVTLSGRADIANNAGADLFISIHINAQEKGTSANGYSIHCLGQSAKEGNDLFSKNLELCKRENSVILLEDDYKTKYQGFDPSDPQSYIFFSLMQNAHLGHSLLFAEDVAQAMKGGPIVRSRGVSQDPFWVLWRTAMPSVLVEVGFITNPADLKVMNDPAGRDRIAGNLLKAFGAFKKRYDGTVTLTQEVPAREKEPDPMVEPSDSGQEESVYYGIQVLATSRRMKPSDPFFKGYDSREISSGHLYKYVLSPQSDLPAAKKVFQEIAKKFPGCFIVRCEGGTTSRVL